LPFTGKWKCTSYLIPHVLDASDKRIHIYSSSGTLSGQSTDAVFIDYEVSDRI
jgi:hypothetical protein